MDDVKKEQLEYLFLDIEWNQAPGTTGLDGREAVQIGLVAADAKMQKIKTFSKAIRLSDSNLFNEKTEVITHTPVANIMQGREENVVLRNFAQTFPEYPYLVVWIKDTYDLFMRDMRKNGISIKRHKQVFLQDVLSIITGNENDTIGFEKALRCAGIRYVPNYLHYAKHDANYLYQLYYQCFQKYSGATVGERCFVNEITRKLHTENFFEVIQYIKNHDAGVSKRLSRKNKLEKLLEMVEMELKMKNTEEKDYGYDNMPELRRTNIG